VTITSVPTALAAAGYPRLGPLAVCFMILAGTAVQQAIGGMAARRSSLVGLPVLATGAGLVVLGTLWTALPLLLAGGALVGSAAYGFLYVGALAAAAEAAPGEDRARAAAGVFLVAHTGFCIPPLITGLAVDRFGALPALAAFWVALVLLCVLLGVLLWRRAGGAVPPGMAGSA
jgi:MFS family permease